jgi:hypothetical protein
VVPGWCGVLLALFFVRVVPPFIYGRLVRFVQYQAKAHVKDRLKDRKFQTLANKRMTEINAAYQALKQ